MLRTRQQRSMQHLFRNMSIPLNSVMSTTMEFYMKEVSVLYRPVAETTVQATFGPSKLRQGKLSFEDLMDSKNETVFVHDVESGTDRLTHRRQIYIQPTTFDVNPKRKAIVCDIDGVLNTILGHGVKTTQSETVQWTDIEKTVDAEPVKAMFLILQGFHEAGYVIIFSTARGDSQRVPTERYLQEYIDYRYTLFMRGLNDGDQSAALIKVDTMTACILPYYDVEFFIEDTQSNVDLMKRHCPSVKTLKIN
ncbi:polynucleotide kinase/phosphatase [Yersinia phage vB_YenM_P778]